MPKNFNMTLVERQHLPDQPDDLHSSGEIELLLPYAVHRIARQARVSPLQAALIAELLAASHEVHHG
ncbi:hypothetical protein [Microvirga zambiensis]|uniref:hypothetical protein n=1 Tax=Microvirga zambiensis TaxID=1402137 RepID=UPI00191D653E|nr:hypothetical protein [Microvirga zambiensis]